MLAGRRRTQIEFRGRSIPAAWQDKEIRTIRKAVKAGLAFTAFPVSVDISLQKQLNERNIAIILMKKVE